MTPMIGSTRKEIKDLIFTINCDFKYQNFCYIEMLKFGLRIEKALMFSIRAISFLCPEQDSNLHSLATTGP
jgi:hypothetical protein